MDLVDFIRHLILAEVRALAPLARERWLAGFRNLDEEAEAAANMKWRELMSRPGTGDEDPADAAEIAHEAGLELHAVLWQLEQATKNLLAAWLYHLFAQHKEEYEAKARRLWREPLDFTGLRHWAVVDELRLVANVAKHAEGSSARQLRKRRPDLFQNPVLVRLGVGSLSPGLIAKPLAGEDLYVTEADLDRYQAAVEDLWEEVLVTPHQPARQR